MQLGLDRMELPPSAVHPGQRRKRTAAERAHLPIRSAHEGLDRGVSPSSDAQVPFPDPPSENVTQQYKFGGVLQQIAVTQAE